MTTELSEVDQELTETKVLSIASHVRYPITFLRKHTFNQKADMTSKVGRSRLCRQYRHYICITVREESPPIIETLNQIIFVESFFRKACNS